ncbi:MAG: papain-like cysteine protease family protein [Byssovorax sp.]
MNKTTAQYAGNPKRFDFPTHKQEHPAGCGPACLRMLAEWATTAPQSEYRWRRVPGWHPVKGLGFGRMKNALKRIPGLMSAKVTGDELKHRRDAQAIRDLDGVDSVYLLLTDCYGQDGTNLKHWIILVDLFRAKNKKRLLALYADPLYDALCVWPWDALLATRVLEGFRIERSTS